MGTRQQWTSGQEITFDDLNSASARIEKGIFDRIIYELLGRKENGFFQDSFRVIHTGSTTVNIKSGLGFISDAQDNTMEPRRKPIVADSDIPLSLNTPDSGHPRTDIVCIKDRRVDGDSETRRFKPDDSNDPVDRVFVVSTDYGSDVRYVAGAPSAAPVTPDIPDGYIKIAELSVAASTGLSGQGAIKDTRVLLPYSVSINPTGSESYDAVVGTAGLQGVNYNDLKAALDNAEDGWKILVISDQVLNAVPAINNNYVEIEFKKNVTVSGTPSTGLQINGSNCKVTNGRFHNFNGAGRSGILIDSGADQTVLEYPAFRNCTANIDDKSETTYVNVELED